MKPSRTLRTAALLVISLFAAPWPARAAGDIEPGAYCPLPKQGEKPRCLGPAMDRYQEFFQALDDESVDDAELGRVERDVAAGAASENAYLALSSLAYGYYQLSLRAAAQESADPQVVARLERWNALLGAAYDASPEDERFRQAVHEAARDLQRRAPPVRLRCVDERGDTVECDSTEAVIRGVNAAAGEVGIRGGLERLLERIVGGGSS